MMIFCFTLHLIRWNFFLKTKFASYLCLDWNTVCTEKGKIFSPSFTSLFKVRCWYVSSHQWGPVKWFFLKNNIMNLQIFMFVLQIIAVFLSILDTKLSHFRWMGVSFEVCYFVILAGPHYLWEHSSFPLPELNTIVGLVIINCTHIFKLKIIKRSLSKLGKILRICCVK